MTSVPAPPHEPSPGERVLSLLPVHVRARDEQAGGLLAALADAVEGELEVLERDIDTLYASWFIETCPEWVVPYIADLVGVTDLPPEVAGVMSRRAFVANTVAYRRRKGTPAVIEQVARDATGWPARAVEYFRLLAATTHVDHVRLDRPATAAVRTPVAASGALELVPSGVAQGALHSVAHTVEVRRIASGRGRYGIGNVGVFLFPDQVHEVGWAPARRLASRGEGWSVHPLGFVTPLYAPPQPEEGIELLATEADLPVPLRPRRLLALLTARRAAGGAVERLPVAVRIDGEELDADRTRVCGLEDLARAAGGGPLAGWQVVVDAVSGRLHPYRSGAPAVPSRIEVRHSYGGTADVGAGTYDRRATHADALAADPYRGGPGVVEQVVVLAADPAGRTTPGIAEAFAQAEEAWAGPEPPVGGTYVISVGDNASYPVHADSPSDVSVAVPEATRLVIVAATWRGRVLGPGEVLPPVDGVYGPEGLRPHLRGCLTVSGDGGSSVVLDGIVVEGDVVVGPGALGSLTLSNCTVAGAVRVGEGGATNQGIAVRVVRSACGPLRFGRGAAGLDLRDSTVDAGTDACAVTGPALHLVVEGCTVLGEVEVRTLEASNAVFDGPVTVENRQTGCVRHSFVTPGSRVPRRYRCAPAAASDVRMRPAFASTTPGSPHFLALAPGCPREIAEGGEGGAEMGVHHHLGRPVRARAAARLLGPYVPLGLELGVRAPLPTGGADDAR